MMSLEPQIESLAAMTLMRTTIRTLLNKGLLTEADIDTIVDDAKETLRTTATMSRIPKTLATIEQFRNFAKGKSPRV
jgi:hypothetical protein